MNRPCGTKIVCSGEFGEDVGNGSNPFLNLSAERPEPSWVPPQGAYFSAEGFCCDTTRKFAYSEISQADANAALATKLDQECATCDEEDKQTFCADASCPDGSHLSRICVATSQAQANSLATAASNAMAPYCNVKDDFLFGADCSCADGSGARTTWSNISQEVARAQCAGALVCSGPADSGGGKDGGPGPVSPHNDTPAVTNHPPPPYPQIGTITNDPTSCTVLCPNGDDFTYTVPAGMFKGKNKQIANAAAYTYACQQAMLQKICVTDLNERVCKQSLFDENIYFSGINSPFTAILIGTLPPGLDWVLDPVGKKITISGYPQSAAAYDFQFAITDSKGNTKIKDFSIDVYGLTLNEGDFITEAKMGECYSYQVSTEGPWVAPVDITITGLPDGLDFDPNGIITGIPTESGTFDLNVNVFDSDDPVPMECDIYLQLKVRDCATEPYLGNVDNGTQTGSSAQYLVHVTTLDKKLCDRTVSVYVDLIPVNSCVNVCSMTINWIKNGVIIDSEFAATVNPFPRQKTTAMVIPAQIAPSGDCPGTAGWEDEYSIELIWQVSADDDNCTGEATWTIDEV